MANVENTPDARVLVGVDISKHRHEVLIAAPGKPAAHDDHQQHRRLHALDCDLARI